MRAYLIRRSVQAAITIILLAVMIFLITRLTGDPVSLMAAEGEMADRARITARLGLDKPLSVQFVRFVTDLAHGNLGISFRFGKPVTDLLIRPFYNTLLLVVPSFLVAIVVGVPLGIVAARKRGKMLGRFSSIIAVLGIATPSFWLGLMFIFVFAGILGWLPSSRMGDWTHYILPVVTLSVGFVAGIMRLIRSSMLEELSSEYVKLARTKGVPEGQITWRHALRNALLPTIAFVATSMSGFITGAISVETVFAWPGVGRLLYDSAIQRDFPLVSGIIIVGGIMIVMLTLATDILSAWLDPRIREHETY